MLRTARNTAEWSGRSILLLLVLGVFISLIFTVSELRYIGEFWQRLGFNILFVSWTILISAVLIKVGRRDEDLADLSRRWLAVLAISQSVVLVSSVLVLVGDSLFVLSRIIWIHEGLFLFRNQVTAFSIAVLLIHKSSSHTDLRNQVHADVSNRLAALQSRIRPHFLFNTLNTISSLIHDRPDQAEQATLDLADLLRTGFKDKAAHALSEELDLINGYLRIEQLRLSDRLMIDWMISDELPLEHHLPPLLLQPLIENAIIHGISRRAEGGTLRIEGQRIRFGRIRFTVTNPLADPDNRPAEGNHSALENIRQRLALAYEERYGLKTWTADGHFIAELTIPVT